jgi:hypothetical protein
LDVTSPAPAVAGLKYKKCHGRFGPGSLPPFVLPDLAVALEQHRAAERIRQAQQGHGRPIIGFKAGDHQMVAVRNTVYFSDQWKTFPDFLSDYIRAKLESAWGNAEIAKPFAERHLSFSGTTPSRDIRGRRSRRPGWCILHR